MSWWLRSRHAPLLAMGVLAELALVVLLGGMLVPAPGLVQGSIGSVPATVLVPLVLNSVVQLCLEGPDRRLERTAVRHSTLMDVCVVGAAAVSLLAGAAALSLLGTADALETARNTLGYLGLGLVVMPLWGARAGALLPAAYVVLLVNFADGGTPGVLEWPIAASSSAGSWVSAAALYGAGVAALLLRDRLGREHV